MKFSIIGYGQVGKAVGKIASKRKHQCVSTMDLNDKWNLKDTEVVFESTTPNACFENLKKLCIEGKTIVVLTTGWYEHLPEITKLAKEYNAKLIWSANFSIGVNIYFKIIDFTSKLFNKIDEYDIWGTEIHHKNKIDSPSGTAKQIEGIILKNIDRKTKVVEEKLDRKINDNEFHFSSTRGGLVNFGHTIGFDSEIDCVEIKHFARNRDGYAQGAVFAGEWLLKQPSGVYTMEDFLSSILKEK